MLYYRRRKDAATRRVVRGDALAFDIHVLAYQRCTDSDPYVFYSSINRYHTYIQLLTHFYPSATSSRIVHFGNLPELGR
jgi:hypothetical protein